MFADAGLDLFQVRLEPVVGEADAVLGVGLPLRPHLFDFKTLRAILAGLKARYDIVLLDAPPLLLSADSEFLAGQADMTLLLIGAGQMLPGELRRAAAILQIADPAAVGFVVTFAIAARPKHE